MTAIPTLSLDIIDVLINYDLISYAAEFLIVWWTLCNHIEKFRSFDFDERRKLYAP